MPFPHAARATNTRPHSRGSGSRGQPVGFRLARGVFGRIDELEHIAIMPPLGARYLVLLFCANLYDQHARGDGEGHFIAFF